MTLLVKRRMLVLNGLITNTYRPYRKPQTISPGLIIFRKRFLMGLYKGGGLIYGGGLYMDDLLC